MPCLVQDEAPATPTAAPSGVATVQPHPGSSLVPPARCLPHTSGHSWAAAGVGAQQGCPLSTPCFPPPSSSSLPALPTQALAQMAASALLLLLVLPAGAWPGLGLRCWLCMHCSCPPWPPATPSPHVRMSDRDECVGLPHVGPTIDISILKGECSWKGGPTVPGPAGTLHNEGHGKRGRRAGRRPKASSGKAGPQGGTQGPAPCSP